MTGTPRTPKSDARAEREARLAARLRENLKRRKAQARARKDSGEGGEDPEKYGA